MDDRNNSDSCKPLKRKVMHMAATSRGAIWMHEQLRGLKERGYEVAAGVSGEGPLTEDLSADGIPHFVFDFGLCWSLSQLCLLFGKIYSLAFFLFRRRYDIVHYQLFDSTLITRIAAWIADVPARINMVPSPYYMESPGCGLVEKKTCWMDSRVVASCKHTYDLYEQSGFPKNKLALIYYGADAAGFNPDSIDRQSIRRQLAEQFGFDQSTPLIGKVAYFYPPLPSSWFVPRDLWGRSIKDHETLIDAVPLVLAEIPQARFLLVGDGWGVEGAQYLEQLRERVHSLGIDHAVIFTGLRADIRDILAALDISIQCPINHENLGGTIESLLMARPLIATRVGGLTDTVIDNATGLLISPGNAEELSRAILRLLKYPEEARQMGENGRRFMLERFTLDTTVANLHQLYCEVLDDAGREPKVKDMNQLPSSTVVCDNVAAMPSVAKGRSCQSPVEACHERKAAIGYRLPVVLFRTLFAVPIIAWVGWTLCQPILPNLRREISNRLYWSVRHSIYAVQSGFRCLQRLAYLSCKRCLDIVISLFLLVTAAPVWLILLCNRQEGCPLVVRTKVLGGLNKPFVLFSMGKPVLAYREPAAESCSERKDAHGLNSRFWWLPSLLNVLHGDISFIGPGLRPLDLGLSPNSEQFQLQMKPGITGWSQLNSTKHPLAIDIDAMDRLYMATSNLILDFKIMVKSIIKFMRT